MNIKQLFHLLGDLLTFETYNRFNPEQSDFRVVTKDGRTVTGVQVDHDKREFIIVTRDPKAETITKAFHETYERLAPYYGYHTRPESAVPWDEVPEENKNLMMAVVTELMDEGIIYGRGATPSPGRSSQEPG